MPWNQSVSATILRALQLVFAILVIGTDAYAIDKYHGRTIHEDYPFGSFDAYQGVPAAWGFLLFCAAWTFLGTIFLLAAGTKTVENVLMGYIASGFEVVAVLSWLAGFVAVAADIRSDACQMEQPCGTIIAATIFGASEWILFTLTTFNTLKTVIARARRPRQVGSEAVTANPGNQIQRGEVKV